MLAKHDTPQRSKKLLSGIKIDFGFVWELFLSIKKKYFISQNIFFKVTHKKVSSIVSKIIPN